MSAEPFCCELARAGEAPLAGTASRAEAWLLLEQPGPWGPRAVEEGLPEPVRRWLERELAALGRARALLVRQDGTGSRGATAFLALATERRRELYRFAAERLEDLPALELAAGIAAGTLEAHRSEERLTLVCTNGRRDRCCARQGVPLYRALAARVGASAWQSTHQGGHRYAATGLWLPEGVAYGFLDAADAAPLAAARAARDLHLPRFRGRTFHPAPVQAADALLRAALAESRLDPWRLESAAEQPGGRWEVVFTGGGRYRVAVERSSEDAWVSCSPPRHKAIDRFALASWELEESR